MNIDIRLLRYFSVVAEELSISRAARRLHMSQPPLSLQIQRLESELGVALLVRNKRGVALTAAGTSLATEAKSVVLRLAQAVDTVQQIGRGELGQLNIGVISSAMWGEFPVLLKRFEAAFPRATWTLSELDPSAQASALIEKRIDMGFWRSGQTLVDGCASVRVAHEPIGVAMSAQHRFAQQEGVDLKALGDENFMIIDPKHSDFDMSLPHACLMAGFFPRITHRVAEPQTLMALAGAGNGIALLPWSLSRIQWPNTRMIRLHGSDLHADLFAFYRDGDPSPVVNSMLSLITDGLGSQD
jgi:DNA-binding transcriptional LysR family regulator